MRAGGPALASVPALAAADATTLRGKADVCALVALVSNLPPPSRGALPLADIAAAAGTDIDGAERLVMRAVATGVLRATMDGVSSTVCVSWVTPRVLTRAQTGALAARLRAWKDKAGGAAGLLQGEGGDAGRVAGGVRRRGEREEGRGPQAQNKVGVSCNKIAPETWSNVQSFTRFSGVVCGWAGARAGGWKTKKTGVACPSLRPDTHTLHTHTPHTTMLRLHRVRPSDGCADEGATDAAPTVRALVSRARPDSRSPRFWRGVTAALDGARAATNIPRDSYHPVHGGICCSPTGYHSGCGGGGQWRR